MPDLTPYEIEVLKAVAGEKHEACWGAAMGEAVEDLRRNRYVEWVITDQGRIAYQITDKGEKALAEHG